jgi:hypothetical protein
MLSIPFSQLYDLKRDILPTSLSRHDFNEIARQAIMSKANAANCRGTFRRLLGVSLPTYYPVRQSLPEDFAGIMKEAGIDIHNPFLLQGVDPAADAQMTRDWANWASQLGHSPSAAEVQAEAVTISDRYAAKLVDVPR